MRPEMIERTSMALIAKNLGEHTIPEEHLPVVMRVIHTTADFDFARTLAFSPNAVRAGREALKAGARVVTDTRMVACGVNEKCVRAFGGSVRCYMADEDIAVEARKRGVTRATVSMERAAIESPEAVFAIGNAPTALLRLCELVGAGKARPALIIGVPVGFVNVEESKEALMKMNVPWIVAQGRKGGSPVAAAVVNSLLYGITEGKETASPREGVSTGSCAAAAAKAAALWLLFGACPEQVEIETPQGRTLRLNIIPAEPGRCGVVKDAGDDPDATDGVTVFADVELFEDDGDIVFRAGDGVGTATLPGLKVPVGEAAINPVPRRMIEEALREVIGARAAAVTVSVPGGEKLAERTFNPRLGIAGGLSILGTAGIVRPMDEQSIRDSLSLELNTHAAQGLRALALTFGRTGEAALRKAFGLTGRCVLQAGNDLGFVLDEAQKLGFEKILLCGHPGKLLKVAAGGFKTHNRASDGRMEALCTHAALLGMSQDFIQKLYACVTTEAAMALIGENPPLWNSLAEAAAGRCRARSFGALQVAAAFVDNEGTVLGESAGARGLSEELAHGSP